MQRVPRGWKVTLTASFRGGWVSPDVMCAKHKSSKAQYMCQINSRTEWTSVWLNQDQALPSERREVEKYARQKLLGEMGYDKD